MKSIAIFCGSSFGKDPQFQDIAWDLGVHLAEQNIQVVYGGAVVGLMGAVANGALSKKGSVIGVIPSFMDKYEITHTGLSDLHVVSSMHERKHKMSELADGFITLPGGFGTIEELFEIITWSQLGLHQKPIAIYNAGGFFDPLIEMLKKMTQEGFLKQSHLDQIIIEEAMEPLLSRMMNYQPLQERKWITKDMT